MKMYPFNPLAYGESLRSIGSFGRARIMGGGAEGPTTLAQPLVGSANGLSTPGISQGGNLRGPLSVPSGSCGGCGTVPAAGGVALVYCQTAGQCPTYGATVPFTTTKFIQGADIHYTRNSFADDLNSLNSDIVTAAYSGPNARWEAQIVAPSAASDLIGKEASFVGVHIQTSNTDALITDLTIEVLGGNIVGAAPAPVSYNRIQMQNTVPTGLVNFFAVLPLLVQETNSQRVNLHRQTFSYAAGPPVEQNGIEVRVNGVPNSTDYSVTAFLANRAFESMVTFGRRIGVRGA